jgi:hypothetical protein
MNQQFSVNPIHNSFIEKLTLESVNNALISATNQLSTKGWIMLLDPDDELISQLSQLSPLASRRILRVKTDRKPLDLKNLAKAIAKGTCSQLLFAADKLNEQQVQTLNKLINAYRTFFNQGINQSYLH